MQSKPWTVFFDHVAVATDRPEKFKRVLLLLGISDLGSEHVSSQGVVAHFLRSLDDDSSEATSVEILEISDPAGTVAKYLEKKGTGIHHISFRVTALDRLCDELRKNSIRLVYEKPRPGAHHTRVNFIHPESTGGILIEVSEKIS